MVGEPVLILHDGVPIKKAMAHEGLTDEQLMTALREHGLTDPKEAHMCVLEVDGSISVVPSGSGAYSRRARPTADIVALIAFDAQAAPTSGGL